MVLAAEKVFPRGGNETSSKFKLPPSNALQLFARKLGISKRGKQRRGKIKKAPTETYISNDKHVMHLSYKGLVEGTVLLGRVRKVQASCLSVCLPGHICGRVSMTDVSSLYTEALKQLSKNVQGCHQLCDMFRAGQPVVVRVEALGPATNDVRLTTDPASIQGRWVRGSVKEGVVLVAAVRSVEEHVYVMDVGVPGVRAFLKKQSSRKYELAWTAGRPLGVGQVLRCVVVKADAAPGSVTVELSADARPGTVDLRAESVPLDSLLPGVRCAVTVSKVLLDGLEVSLSERVVGHVPRSHLLNPLDSLQDYDEGQEYSGTLLYVVPTLKLPHLSLRADACPDTPARLDSNLQQLPVGSLVHDCPVISVDGQGILLQLGDRTSGLRGYVSHKRALGAAAHDPERSLMEELRSRYPLGSRHSCRVLDYDYMDQMFICSTERALLKARYVHPCNVTAGDLVWCEVDVVGPQAATVFVLGAGKDSDYKAFTAAVPVRHLSDVPLSHPEKKFTQGSRWKARVLSVKDLSVVLTLKGSLVSSKLPVLSSYQDAVEGSCYEGTVYRILSHGLLVKFYGDVSGFVQRACIPASNDKLENTFYLGQTVRCYVQKVNLQSDGLFLTLEPPASEAPVQLPLEEAKEAEQTRKTSAEGSSLLHAGRKYKVRVDEQDLQEGCLRVSGKHRGVVWRGLIPALHLTDCSHLAQSLLSTYSPGETLQAYCWSPREYMFTLRPSAVAFFQEEGSAGVVKQGLRAARSGQLLPCSVTSVSRAGIITLQLPLPTTCTQTVQAPLAELGDVKHTALRSLIQPHMPLIGCVRFSRRKRPHLSLKLSDVCTNTSQSAVELLQTRMLNVDKVLQHEERVRGSVLAGLRPGSTVACVVKEVLDAGITLKLKPSGITCTVPSTHLPEGEHKEIGSKGKVTVLCADPVTGSVDVTMNPVFMARISSQQDGELPSAVKVGSVLQAQVMLVKEAFVLVAAYGTKGRGRLVYVPTRCHMNQLLPDTCACSVGDKARVVVRRIVGDKAIGIFKSLSKNGARATSTAGEESSRRKVKQKAGLVAEDDVAVERQVVKKQKSTEAEAEVSLAAEARSDGSRKRKPSVSASGPDRAGSEAKSARVSESDVERGPNPGLASALGDGNGDRGVRVDVPGEAAPLGADFVWQVERLQLPQLLAPHHADTADDSSEDDQPEHQVGKKKRVTAAEKKELARQEEARIRDLEMKLMNDAKNPQTADDFDRLLLASPNSSALWVQYMVFHLQAAEVGKARAVAQRALKTISFREEAEKLNVWLALLNLENLYGTPESLGTVLKDAVQMNDAQTVYLKMLHIYCTSNKKQEAEQLVSLVCKKFKQQQEVWVQSGAACMKLGLVDKARSLLQRALASLDKKLHVATISKFAQLEQQYGSLERAQTLMEQVLTSYPQRVDVWSSYVDMLVKSGSLHIARQVLERAVAQKLSTHKMKTLFKKYLNLEEAHGTPEGVSRVRQMALSYVEAITSSSSRD